MRRISLASILLLPLLAAPAAAQLAERPGDSLGSRGPKDLSGLSVKWPRIRLVHTEDLALPGGTWWLQRMDPFLAWKMGKDLTQRQMRIRDGVFAVHDPVGGIAGFGGTLSDGSTPAITARDQVSCGGCHNSPYRDAGAGTNFAKKSGLGRNSPHFYGSGLMEMLAWQIRQKMMQQMDPDRNNWVSKAEMNGARILVEPVPGATPLDFGVNADNDGDGWPDLNGIFRVWFVDAQGRVVQDATSLYDSRVAGYNFMMEVFGWGEKRFGLNNTNRVFVWDPFNAHGGLQAYDPTCADDPDGDGFSQVSNAGLQQSWVGHMPPDAGNQLNSVGLSVDDPDGDGVICEISEGDLDVAEWYLLNSPRPGRGRETPLSRAGERAFRQMQCNSCHVLDWWIEPADLQNPDVHRRYLGDLRFFDLDVRWDPQDERLEGRLDRLYTVDPVTGERVPNRDGFLVQGIGTDFRHHDMGPAFQDMQYDGALVTSFRTAPLWGNGHTYPYGHDGKSMTLDEVIRRHGGEAQASRDLYVNASKAEQEAVLAFLRTFVLYPTDQVPCDIDGDGIISDHYIVAGKDTGYERFNPEWLFRVPGQIEGIVRNPDGAWVRSDALVNVEAAYGLTLPGIMDSDRDGFPDLLDPCPQTPGWRDGCR